MCCRCQYCSKTFTRKEHMVNHVRKHTGETPHRCDICKKSFTRKEHFMNHVMWHTGETPHHCQACGKKYTRKEHLANHMRSHTNDTPFRCEICGELCNFLFFIFFLREILKNAIDNFCLKNNYQKNIFIVKFITKQSDD